MPVCGVSDAREAQLLGDRRLGVVAGGEADLLALLGERRYGQLGDGEMPGVHRAQGVLAHELQRTLLGALLGDGEHRHGSLR